MEWKAASESSKVPDNWIFMHYYDALNALFRIENSLRVIVFLILKKNFGGKWQDINISTDDQANITISALAKKRMTQDQNFGYLGYPIASPLMHLTSGELVGILTSNAYWKYFKEYFGAAKDVVTLKLQEIGKVRNALAHFRPINAGDVEVVKQNARQVLSKIEETLGQLARLRDRVPSNTQEPWYGELSTLGSPLLTVDFHQSPDEQWIKVGLLYNHPKVGKSYATASYKAFRILTIKTPVILSEFPILCGHVAFAFEEDWTLVYQRDPEEKVRKKIGLVFSRKILRDEFKAVKGELEGLIRIVTDETDLIQADNLARGKVVTVSDVKASKEDSSSLWRVNADRLLNPVTPETVPEFWGSFRSLAADFISNTESFPWMPVLISEPDEIPF